MGMAKYFEDNMEIIEERLSNRNSLKYTNYNTAIIYTRKPHRYIRPKKLDYYVIIDGKRIAV